VFLDISSGLCLAALPAPPLPRREEVDRFQRQQLARVLADAVHFLDSDLDQALSVDQGGRPLLLDAGIVLGIPGETAGGDLEPDNVLGSPDDNLYAVGFPIPPTGGLLAHQPPAGLRIVRRANPCSIAPATPAPPPGIAGRVPVGERPDGCGSRRPAGPFSVTVQRTSTVAVAVVVRRGTCDTRWSTTSRSAS
jgi:hypothetical protein